MRGTSNLKTSRRTHPLDCKWWKIDDKNKNLGKLIVNEDPEANFNAKYANNENNSKTVVAQSFMFDNHSVTIETNDDLNGIKQNDYVSIDGEIWRVDGWNRRQIRNNSRLNYDITYTYYLDLRR